MFSKGTSFFLFILLIFLQSCSGGRVGNFLELSFSGIDNKNSDEEYSAKLNMVDKENKISKNSKNLKKPIISEKNKFINKKNDKDLKNLIEEKKNLRIKLIKDENNFQVKKSSSEKNLISKKQNDEFKDYKPQSYKVTIILKKVDPTAPSEKFASALREAKLDFEIEKIERYFETEVNDKENKLKFKSPR
tara:strand:- start:8600 stop:9169 length:570 start_codon:yes stop_codon:yes gene_type:complete